MEDSWQVLEETAGAGVAEVLRGLLEAQDIPVLLSQEGAGHFVYPTTVGRLGWVQILVPASRLQEARQVMEAYHRGEFETAEPSDKALPEPGSEELSDEE